jgi:hypothetical protein
MRLTYINGIKVTETKELPAEVPSLYSDKSHKILINLRHDPYSLNFQLAHELGHAVHDNQPTGDLYRFDKRFTDAVERRANITAFKLAFYHYLKTNISNIVDTYGIPEELTDLAYNSLDELYNGLGFGHMRDVL